MDLRKKLALALVALSVSGVAAAGTYTPPACTAVGVTVPCENSGWDIGFEAFFVQATSNYQIFANDSLASDNSTRNFGAYGVNPDYKFGFQLEGSFHFGTGNDITVAWEHADDSSDTNVINATNGVNLALLVSVANTSNLEVVTNLGNINGFGITNRVFASHNYEFDAVNAEFGQHIDVGSDVDMRVHAGLQYARIEYTKSNSWIGNEVNSQQQTIADATHLMSLESEFEGIGARFGTDMAYQLGDGFALVGRASASLLVGNIDTNNRLAVANAAGTVTDAVSVSSSEESVVVPAGMGKLGARYAADVFDGNLSVEGGWRWEGYFQSMRFGTPGFNTENFTFSGPYVSVKYVA